MIAEIGAGLSSLQAALDLAKGLSAVATQATINEIKIDLQQRILDAQAALNAAGAADASSAARIRELEQQIVQLKDWEAEKQRYQLHEIMAGVFTYAPKPEMLNGQPPHHLCTNCFERGQKRFLQRHNDDARATFLRCTECAANLKIGGTGVRPVGLD